MHSLEYLKYFKYFLYRENMHIHKVKKTEHVIKSKPSLFPPSLLDIQFPTLEATAGASFLCILLPHVGMLYAAFCTLLFHFGDRSKSTSLPLEPMLLPPCTVPAATRPLCTLYPTSLNLRGEGAKFGRISEPSRRNWHTS